jgi:streptogramin lyase
VARGLAHLASVTTAPGGTIYAIADEKLFRVGGGRVSLVWASSDEGPTDCAAAADGVVYVARYGDHVDRVAPDGSVSVVARGFDRPHGITLTRGGALLVADTYAGAIRRIGRDGSVTTVATGVGRPMDVAVAPDGSLLVADLAGRRLLRIHGGATTVVARRLGAVTGVAIANGAVYVVAGDGPFKVARIGPHGSVTAIA